MIEIIPLPYYYQFFINGTLAMVLLTFVHTIVLDIDDKKNIMYIKTLGMFLLFFVIFYIGLRPVSGFYFGDMRTYSNHFIHYSHGGDILDDKDIFFNYFMKFTSNFLSSHLFFLVCAFIYVFPLYKVSKSFFKEYWFYSFFMLIISFSFWTYGTNGIRNGMATSLFLLGLSYQKNNLLKYVFFVLACLFHKTMLLPVVIYVITLFYNKPDIFLKFWIVAIPMSIILGGFWIAVFTSLGFADDRLGAYLSSESTGGDGFRYDFLIYSTSAVFTGWYFIFKRKFEDPVYYQIYNIYLLTNAFWILVIRANFSNRFAYLSWFLMGLVIIYPYLKLKFFKNHHFVIGKVIVAYFAFTYLMYYIYYN